MASSGFVHTCLCVLTVQVWLLLLISGVGDGGTPPQIKQAPCTCHDQNQCRRIPPSSTKDKESIVFTNASSDFTRWDWKGVTMVIATPTNDSANFKELMCYSHHENTQFGFQVDSLPHLDDLNTTSEETQKWMRKIAQMRLDLRADAVVVDLVDLFHSDDVDLDALIKLLHHVKDSISPVSAIERTPVTLICVLPWKPPCVKKDCSFTERVTKICDLFVLSPRSYLYLKGYGCKARATIPATKMALGVDDYAVRGVHEDKIILGVPWHGYEYNCDEYSPDSDICLLKQVPIKNSNDTKCGIETRVQLSLGDLVTKHYKSFTKTKTDPAYKAPYYTYFDNASATHKQVWFENSRSLRLKYQFAHDFGLKGVGIYTAEDLSQQNTERVEGFNGGMWNWILHGLIQEQVTQPPPTKYHSDTVAGIAIGCMILGVVLGVVFMVILFRVRAKKKAVERPFRKDAMDEYHDDEDLNL